MSDELIDKYAGEARAMERPRREFPVPFHVLFGEAVELAAFAWRHWEPRPARHDQAAVPGLREVGGSVGQRIPSDIAVQLRELVAAGMTAHSRYLAASWERRPSMMTEAGRVLGELAAALKFLLRGGEDDHADFQRRQLASTYAQPTSHDEMAMALDEHAGLAQRHRSELAGLGGFSAATIDRARRLAEQLRERSTERNVAAAGSLDLRNRLLTLLYDRMHSLRVAARFVFRAHPAILRESISDYQRRRRAAWLQSRATAAAAAG